MSDVSYRYAEKVLQGRRAIQNDETGTVTFVDTAVPEVTEEPSATSFISLPNTEEEEEAFDLIGAREKQLDEAFKPAGAAVDREVFGMSIAAEEQFVQDAKPVKPVARKSRKATEGDK